MSILYNETSLVSTQTNEFSLICRGLQKVGAVFVYNAETMRSRIKQVCKDKGISMKFLLSECGLGVNAIRQINDAGGMYSFSLARIADVLDVSVDYLLGRTDQRDVNR